ncbi:D-alanine--D-alanine ligase [Fervidicella metallireducens AeB]|uniref:D-alanine--D-alanine ligase n=1 Tax=Fervidicella metallireducens AeB TaxID=1403537 RepID=A0A017RU80_9CLOT|nr:D-alanine--D-alanine ligase [Fervidicella metallireducens]EYE87974.1 D-alanine--D-alanine ligase [Fervidicella metallireducens AeB]
MKVGVIMGGISAEREVSLNTGKEMVKALDKNKYEVIPIVINTKEDLLEKAKDIDIALLALHGKFGEDGTVQGVLETMGIPYTGCGVLSSALCMDKDMTKRILRFGGINTADWIIVKDKDKINYECIEKLGYPLVVKPNSGGSSVATSIVNSREELETAVIEALKFDNEVMVEDYIKGDEITCPVLNGVMLPILAIKPKSNFFDYNSKYSDAGAEEYVVELDKDLHKQIEQMAVNCFKLLKCKVYARVDFILKDGEPYLLEINTLPGMTRNSLFPKSAKAAGIEFSQLLDMIIEYSLNEKVS